MPRSRSPSSFRARQSRRRSRLLLDQLLPTYDVAKRYALAVPATPARVFSAAEAYDLRDSHVTRVLMRLRGYGPRMRSTGARAPLSETLTRFGFVFLGKIPCREMASASRDFWRPDGRLLALSAERLVLFESRVTRRRSVTSSSRERYEPIALSTEDPSLCLGEEARRPFLRYWSGSSLSAACSNLRSYEDSEKSIEEGERPDENNPALFFSPPRSAKRRPLRHPRPLPRRWTPGTRRRQPHRKRSIFLISPDAVFLERTPRSAGPSKIPQFAHPYFARGKAWASGPCFGHFALLRGSVAWFDESLETMNLGPCRGTGVLVLDGNHWKIAQYNLSVPIPNALMDEFKRRIEDEAKKPH